MLKFNNPTAAIRIKKLDSSQLMKRTNDNGFPVENWVDVIDEDILCEWQNKFGGEALKAAELKALDSATIKLWYIHGINQKCRITRLEDEAVFEIISLDDVMNRHQQLVIEIKRYVRG